MSTLVLSSQTGYCRLVKGTCKHRHGEGLSGAALVFPVRATGLHLLPSLSLIASQVTCEAILARSAFGPQTVTNWGSDPQWPGTRNSLSMGWVASGHSKGYAPWGWPCEHTCECGVQLGMSLERVPLCALQRGPRVGLWVPMGITSAPSIFFAKSPW